MGSRCRRVSYWGSALRTTPLTRRRRHSDVLLRALAASGTEESQRVVLGMLLTPTPELVAVTGVVPAIRAMAHIALSNPPDA